MMDRLSVPGDTLAVFVVKHFVLVFAFFAVGLLLRKAPAALRHRYWLMAFFWIACLPLLEWRIPRPTLLTPGALPIGASLVVAAPAQPVAHGLEPGSAPRVAPTGISAASSNQPKAAAAHLPAFAPQPARWPIESILIGVYALGELFCLGRIGASLSVLRRIVRKSVPADPNGMALLARAAKASGLRKCPQLLINPDVRVPLTFWLGRPVVVAPSADVPEPFLLHECAHIRRLDWFSQAFAALVCAIFWFDPLVWLAERQMRAAGELAADEVVISAGVDAAVYADELVSIATLVSSPSPRASLAVVGGSDLKSRIRLLLRHGKRMIRVPFRWMAAMALTGLIAAGALGVAYFAYAQAETNDSGFIDLGGGYWIRVFAITELTPTSARSWNMKGELLPRLVGPIPGGVAMEPQKRRTKAGKEAYVVFETNLEDQDGFSAHVNGLGLHLIKPEINFAFSTPNATLGRSSIWPAPVDLADSPTASVLISVAPQTSWKELEDAVYKDGRRVSWTGEPLLPANLDKVRDLDVTIPAGAHSHAQLRFYRDGISAGSEDIDADAEGRVPFKLFGDPKGESRLEVRVLSDVKQFLIRNVPMRPKTDRVMPTELVQKLNVHDAAGDGFVFSNGDRLTLRSLSAGHSFSPQAAKWVSWGLSGRRLPFDPQTRADRDHQNWLPEHHDGVSSPLSLQESTDHPTIFHFSLSHKGGIGDAGPIELFEADGIGLDDGYDERDGKAQSDLFVHTWLDPELQSSDLLARIPDPAAPEGAVRMTLEEAYAHHDVMRDPNEYYDLRFAVEKSDRLTALTRDPKLWTEVRFLDARGRVMPCHHDMNDVRVDTYLFEKGDPRKIATVEVLTRPYVYIRFPNVPVNPK